MSNVQIPNLPAAIALNGSEQLEAVQAGTSVRITTAQISVLGTGLSLPWAVSVGGTGNTSFTQYGLLYGDGTNPIAQTGVGAVGEFLLGTGSAPVWGTLASNVVTGLSFGTTGLTPASLTKGNITVAGTLVAANGGTGISSYTNGDLLYASGSTTLATLADVAVGSVLVSGGVSAAPSWSDSPSLTSLTVPTIYGGAGAASTLTLQSTSGAGTTDAILFKVGNAGATTAMYISTLGAVGIGTTTPTALVNLYHATAASLLVQGDANVNNTVYRASTDATGSSYNNRKSRGTISSPLAVASGDIIGNLNFQSFGGTNTRTVAIIRGVVDTYTSDTDISSYLTFLTTPAGSVTAVERMRINSTGNVGINTSLAIGGATIGTNALAVTGTSTFNNNIGIGGNATTFVNIANPSSITGATSAYAQRNNGNVQSDVTVLAAAYFSNIALANASFTTTDLVHFLANPPTGGAGSTATNQYGFRANSTLGSNGAATVTNSFGFYGDLAAAANKWNLYMNGTAQNYLAGGLGIGTTSLGGTGLTTASVWGGTAAGSTLTLTSTTNASASGDQILIKVGNSGGVTAATFASTDAFLQLGAGTTAIAPLKFTSGTNLTTATAGSVEYNGVTALVTPIGAERGLAVTPQYYVNNATRTGPTAAASFVNITPVEPSLSASTRYAFEIYFAITKTSANACTGAIGFSVTGTAPTAISYQVVSTTGATQSTVATASYMSNYLTSGFGTAVPVTAASAASANTYHTVSIKGTIDTGAGAITSFAPQFQYSTGSPTASTFQVGSYMYIYPLSATGAATSVGTWA